MPLIDESVAWQLTQEFQQLVNPVRLAVFSQPLSDPGSEALLPLVSELAALDSRLRVESFNFALDQEKAAALGIKRSPAVGVMGEARDYGIRFYGLPSGYEFGTLIDAILDVSKGDSGLAPSTREALAALPRAVQVQVFSTPTCGYCPAAVRMAFRFAIESDNVKADGIEVTGFPDLVQQHRISSVPKTVIDDRTEFVGAGPEELLLKYVQAAAAAAVVAG
jgi:glutaredoxin-like protein